MGQALLVLGGMAGLQVWGTARGEHAALIRELGAQPIDYQREDFTRVVACRRHRIECRRRASRAPFVQATPRG